MVKTGDELKDIGSRLGEIRDELGHQTTATVQGWENKGPGTFIYWFLENKINDHETKHQLGTMHSTYINRQLTQKWALCII